MVIFLFLFILELIELKRSLAERMTTEFAVGLSVFGIFLIMLNVLFLKELGMGEEYEKKRKVKKEREEEEIINLYRLEAEIANEAKEQRRKTSEIYKHREMLEK